MALNILHKLRFKCQGRIMLFEMDTNDLSYRELWRRLHIALAKKFFFVFEFKFCFFFGERILYECHSQV